jgi:hypothetical protein
MRVLAARAMTAAAALAVLWPTMAAVAGPAPAVSRADEPCTKIPYYGCIPGPVPVATPPDGGPRYASVPEWTPSLDFCGALGRRVVVGNICI